MLFAFCFLTHKKGRLPKLACCERKEAQCNLPRLAKLLCIVDNSKKAQIQSIGASLCLCLFN